MAFRGWILKILPEVRIFDTISVSGGSKTGGPAALSDEARKLA